MIKVQKSNACYALRINNAINILLPNKVTNSRARGMI
jgi:hypothetical protein